MNNQARRLQDIVSPANPTNKNTHFVAITSGKGGVGKSTISANLANVLSQNGYKTALLDADIGLANLDVILNVKMGKNLLHVLKGECGLREILVPVNENLTLIPGESGDEICDGVYKFRRSQARLIAQSLQKRLFVIDHIVFALKARRASSILRGLIRIGGAFAFRIY